jgi:hypothetical protein
MTTSTLERADEKVAAELALDGIISAYLYYLEYDGGTTVRNQAIYEFYDRPDAVVDKENLILQLVTNAHVGGDDPIPYTENPAMVMMRRKSYLIVAAANAADIDSSNPIQFVCQDAAGNQNDGSHTFQDVRFSTITFGPNGADRLQIVACENLMQSMAGGGNLAAKEWEDFQFALQFDGVQATLLTFDSGGTNMGPPVPPPTFRAPALRTRLNALS